MGRKIAFALGLAMGIAYWLRRMGAHWGATDLEALSAWPGDHIVQAPTLATMHGITINATPAQVWPWVVQMGYYRGGWHTDPSWWDYLADRYLRSLVREETEKTGVGHRDWATDERIVPEYQDLKVGDVILDGPPGTAFFTVEQIAPERLVSLYSNTHLRFLFPMRLRENPVLGIGGEFSWVFILYRTGDGRTRVLLRTRGDARPLPYRLFLQALLPLADWPTARKLLTGLKRQVERAA
ncbi:MAG: hypothetical protein ACM30E_05310 [Nitrososphaerales archaeon]